MPLTVKEVENAKPKGKVYYMADSDGLRLKITEKGLSYWEKQYRDDVGIQTIYFGSSRKISLAEARKLRNWHQEHLANCGDECRWCASSVGNKYEGKNQKTAEINTFGKLYYEFIQTKDKNFSFKNGNRYRGWVKKYLNRLQDMPINEVKPADIIDVLKKCEHKDPEKANLETRDRLHEAIKSVFESAVISQLVSSNVANFDRKDAGLQQRTGKHKPEHYRMLDKDPEEAWKKLPDFWKAVSQSQNPVIPIYIKLVILCMARPGNVLQAEWSEFNFKEKVWSIPAIKMKKDRPHLEPLSDQSMGLLKKLKKITGDHIYLFPRQKGVSYHSDNHMSEGAARNWVKELKFDCHLHGFRHMASSYLHSIEEGEEGEERSKWDSMWIEYQLAHCDKNSVRRVYNKANYIKARRRMLQWYSDQFYANLPQTHC